MKVSLNDGSYHEVDSSEMAFKIAGSMAIQEAMRRGAPVVLEPVMKVEVVTPEEYMGDVIGQLNSKRGRIEGMEPEVWRAGCQGSRSVGEHVWLHHRAALDNARTRDVHDGIWSL